MAPMAMKVVDLIAGARPNFVKLAPANHVEAGLRSIYRTLEERWKVEKRSAGEKKTRCARL